MSNLRPTSPTNNRDYLAKKTPGAGLKDFEPQIDMDRLRRYRLSRLRKELSRRNIGACLLYDMTNIRYATGTRNMSVFTGHYPTRYAVVFAEGPVILFDSESFVSPVDYAESVDDVRPARNWYFEANGEMVAEAAESWAAEINDLMQQHCPDDRRLAVDRLGAMGFMPLHNLGIEICDGQECLNWRGLSSPMTKSHAC